MEKYDAGLKIIAEAQKARAGGKPQEAYGKYVDGIDALFKAVNSEKDEERVKMVRKHIANFLDEADAAKKEASKPNQNSVPLQCAQASEKKAREFEKTLKFAFALQNYKEAAEHYKNYQKEVEGNEALEKFARERLLQMITKAETFQKLTKKQVSEAEVDAMIFDLPSVPTTPKAGQTPAAVVPPAAGSTPPRPVSAPVSRPVTAPVGGVKLPNSLTSSFVRGKNKGSDAEQKVLVRGSKINGKTFEPFFATDAEDRNFLGEPFSDSEGLIKLSDKQKKHDAVWGRPSQFMSSPEIIKNFHYLNILQTLVGDCSFVSSLAVCAGWERRFKKTLISRNIHPQRNGVPVVSPNGKYVVKMYLNGTVRKIVIDDFLPVAKNSNPRQLLCSYSSIPNELWVSLFEKAYIKLHGSYDFPGSTSSIDLHALCGWIPETFRLKAKSENDADKLDPDQAWQRMFKGHNKGTALFTMGTRELSEAEEERTGLAEKHAYAVLEVREACGRRVVRLKNPWCHMRWKGDFSPGDEKNWTPELKEALGFDQEAAKEEDNGIFWISWEAVCHFFASIHASWSPARFSCRKNTHFFWQKTHADRKHFDDNPQFLLRVSAKQKTMVWLLLHRHYTSTDYEPSIALHVAKGTRRVFHNSKNVFQHHGVYRSSPNFLLRLPVDKGEQAFVLVVSLFEDTGTLPFTITCYAEEPAALYTAVDCPLLEGDESKFVSKSFKYRWDDKTAGGSPNRPDFEINPMFRLEISESMRVFIKLVVSHEAEKSPKYPSAVGLHLYHSGQRVKYSEKAVPPQAGEEAYTPHIAWREYQLPEGAYTLVPASFESGEFGDFFITVKSEKPIPVSSLPYKPPATPRPPATADGDAPPKDDPSATPPADQKGTIST